jgi:Ca2+-binding RTX toxin-like protein
VHSCSTTVRSHRSRAIRAAASATVIETLEGRRLLDALLPQSTIQDDTPQAGEFFGDYIATHGNLVAVGQPGEAGDGIVKIFDRTTGALVDTVTNPDPDDSSFGSALTFIDANTLAVTDFEGFAGPGQLPQVHVFNLSGNTSVTIHAPTGVEDFGNSLAAVNGDLLVSAPFYGGNLAGTGGVYRYDLSSSNQVDLDTPEALYEDAGADNFGLVMAADPAGTSMFFSSNDVVGGQRRVYEYEFDGVTDSFVADYQESAAIGGSFALAFNDDYLFVGDTNLGRVTRFGRNDASVTDVTIADSGFGNTIAVNGAHVVIGAQTAAQAYVYEIDNFAAGAEVGTIADPQAGGFFAATIRSLDTQRIVVTDSLDNGFAGVLYVYDLADLGGGGPTTPTVDGTADNDTIIVTQSGTTLTVTVNGVATTYENLELLVINGGDGNDTIGVAANVTTSIEAHGGAGNDMISGGASADVLVGDEGSDVLVGQAGRDVLIGGDGSDILLGLADDDVLIAGATAHDDDSATLQEIRGIWTSNDTYTNRVNALKAGPLTPDTDIYDDADIDILSGNGGTDWYVINNDGSLLTRDLVVGATSGEIRDDVDAFIPA